MIGRTWAMRFASATGVSLAAAAVLGCGGSDEPEPADARRGELVVHKSLAAGPIFTEGSRTRLRVIGPDGALAFDGVAPVESLDAPVYSAELVAGTYRVTAVERPCAGTCEQLDPPAARCAVEAEVRPRTTTRVDIRLRAGRRGASAVCSISDERLTCPQTEAGGRGFDARTLRGLDLRAAEAEAQRHGCTVRVVERDGLSLARTHDLRPNRVNVAVTGERVTRVDGIG